MPNPPFSTQPMVGIPAQNQVPSPQSGAPSVAPVSTGAYQIPVPNIAATPGLTPAMQSVLGGYQVGLNLDNLDAIAKQNVAKNAQQQQLNSDLQALSSDPTPQNFLSFMTRHPQHAASMKEQYAIAEKQGNRTHALEAAQIYYALENNDLRTAYGQATNLRDAYAQAGNARKANEFDVLANTIRTNPKAARQQAGFTVATLMPDALKGMAETGKIGAETTSIPRQAAAQETLAKQQAERLRRQEEAILADKKYRQEQEIIQQAERKRKADMDAERMRLEREKMEALPPDVVTRIENTITRGRTFFRVGDKALAVARSFYQATPEVFGDATSSLYTQYMTGIQSARQQALDAFQALQLEAGKATLAGGVDTQNISESEMRYFRDTMNPSSNLESKQMGDAARDIALDFYKRGYGLYLTAEWSRHNSGLLTAAEAPLRIDGFIVDKGVTLQDFIAQATRIREAEGFQRIGGAGVRDGSSQQPQPAAAPATGEQQ